MENQAVYQVRKKPMKEFENPGFALCFLSEIRDHLEHCEKLNEDLRKEIINARTLLDQFSIS